MGIPCRENAKLRQRIIEFAEVLKLEAHKLGDHGLSEEEFYNSGLFRGAIERIRGQYSASMQEKRDFVKDILNRLEDDRLISSWQSSGGSNRHDYSVTLNSGKIAVIELKGCLDGNNTTIFTRPPHANEFLIWSVCSNPGADPRHNLWSGIHTRLGADIIDRSQQIEGLIVWDMVCGTFGRPCPKMQDGHSQITNLGPYKLPPPCIYLFPSTIPSPRNNPNPPPYELEEVEFLSLLAATFGTAKESTYQVSLQARYRGADLERRTAILRNGIEDRVSDWTPLRRA